MSKNVFEKTIMVTPEAKVMFEELVKMCFEKDKSGNITIATGKISNSLTKCYCSYFEAVSDETTDSVYADKDLVPIEVRVNRECIQNIELLEGNGKLSRTFIKGIYMYYNEEKSKKESHEMMG